MRVGAIGVLFCGTSACFGQVITTVAGTDFGFPRTPLPALNAPLSRFGTSPGINARAIDGLGNLLVADSGNNRVFQLSPSGILSVVAGSGLPGYSGDGGPAVNAALNAPLGVAIDGAGNIYIGDSLNYVVRKVSTSGIITTVAGNGRAGYSGDGGSATAAELRPGDIVLDATGNLFIADNLNNVVRKVSLSGIITTVAGNGTKGYSGDEGLATAAELATYSGGLFGGLAVDGSGNLYIADYANFRIRQVSPDGMIHTVAGTGEFGESGDGGPATAAELCAPNGVSVDGAGNLFIAETCNIGRIRKLSPDGNITSVAGNGDEGDSGDGGPATSAALNPETVVVDPAGILYISQQDGYLRKVSLDGQISTIGGNGQFNFAGDGGQATRANLSAARSVALGQDGSLYIADTANFRVRKVSPAGAISTIAGTGVLGYTDLALAEPEGLAFDADGNLYIADDVDIREVSPDGSISTFFQGLNGASAVAVDGAGRLYVSDSLNNRVLKLFNSHVGVLVAPKENLNAPTGVAVGGNGTVFIADTNNQRILAVSPAGIVTTVAGTGVQGYSGDGGPATAAQLNYPVYVTVDPTGNLYFADSANNVIREVSTDGTITTVAGNGGNGYSGDGGSATAAQLSGPGGVAVDGAGNLFIADAGNNRIREVLTSAPSLSSAPQNFVFSGSSAGAPSLAQVLTISSSIPYVPFSVSVATTDGNGWLSVDASSGVAPRAIQVVADPSALGAGSYSGTITIQSAVASPGAISIPVSFSVGPGLPPSLALDQSNLTFTFPAAAQARSQSIRLLNTGGGTLSFSAAVLPGSPWLTVAPASGQATPSLAATLTATANPSGLPAGTYTGAIAIKTANAGSVTIPVTMTLSTNPSALLLSQAGVSFTAIAGGGVVPPQNFGVLTFGNGPLTLSADSTTVTGGKWLAAATSVAPAGLPSVDVTVDPTGLAAGHYYGLVNVRSPGAANSPQVATAVLQVLPAGTDVGAVLLPSELTFNATAGAESPGSQTVSVYNLTATPKAFTASSSDSFVRFAPIGSVVTPDQPTLLVVQPFTSALAPGTYHSSITLQFDDLRVRTIGLTIVVAAQNTASFNSLARHALDTTGACQPSQLLPTLTSLGSGFSVPAGWPVVLLSQIQDDCGTPLENGSVVAEFSNGDPSLTLQSLTGGRWDGTWQTVRSAAGVTVTIRASSQDGQLSGSKQVLGGFDSSQQPPVVAPGGIVDAASNISFRPLTPGSAIGISGTLLSDQTVTAPAVPYGTSLGDTSVLIAGNLMPVMATDSKRVSAIIPYGIAVNTQQQIVVLRADTLSLPVQVNLAAASPAIFTTNGSQGAIVDLTGKFVAPGNAAKAGDTITVYCTGLGELQQTVNAGDYGPPTSATAVPVSLSIGGQTAQIQFSGLAPQLVGIYFVQATVPSGVTAGDQVPVTLTSLAASPAVSPTVTMAVKN